MTQAFTGKNVDELIRVLETVVRDGQPHNTGPILASVDGKGNQKNSRLIHTVVPITDGGGSNVVRLFVYSERRRGDVKLTRFVAITDAGGWIKR